MNPTPPLTPERLTQALRQPEASHRLRAALAAGTYPDGAATRDAVVGNAVGSNAVVGNAVVGNAMIDVLVTACRTEPDFYVRDMLTWALTRQDPDAVIRAVLPELTSDLAQARSQALHTLTKLDRAETYAAIPHRLLADPDAEVARTAWRAAVQLAPAAEQPRLAELLLPQLGRGDLQVQRSLSRALVALGELTRPGLEAATTVGSPAARAHAISTLRLQADPEAGFEHLLAEARRALALRDAPL